MLVCGDGGLGGLIGDNECRRCRRALIWCLFQNNIPVFSPALTDGALGDLLFIFSRENPGLIVDIVEGETAPLGAYVISLFGVRWSDTMHFIPDVSKLNNLVLAANSTGIITLGGGLAKHHTCNANCWVGHFSLRPVLNGFAHSPRSAHLVSDPCFVSLQRDGADYAVYVNTAQEFDGCDSGARPDEAVSWGKIRAEAKPVKVPI